MVAEDLVFWLDGFVDEHSRALCRRCADAMVVPRGWTLDDRRQPAPQLFSDARFRSGDTAERPRPRRRQPRTAVAEQLVIDGTGEVERPAASVAEPVSEPSEAWVASFDPDDDLDGMLRATSPLLSRAFRSGRQR